MASIRMISLPAEIDLKLEKEENASALIVRLLNEHYNSMREKQLSLEEKEISISQQIEQKLAEAKKLEEQKHIIEENNEHKRLSDLELFKKKELELIKRKEEAKIKIDIINAFGLTGKKGKEEFMLFVKEKYPQYVELFQIK